MTQQQGADTDTAIPRAGFIATAVISLVVLIGLIVHVHIVLLAQEERRTTRTTDAAIQVLAKRLGERFDTRFDFLTDIASRYDTRLALRSLQQPRAVQPDDQPAMLTEIWILPADWLDPVLPNGTHVGYTVIDLAQRVMNAGRWLPAELYRAAPGDLRLALAVPVIDQDKIAGAVVALGAPAQVEHLLDEQSDLPAEVWLRQRDGEQALSALDDMNTVVPDATVDIPGTRLSIAYRMRLAFDWREDLGTIGLVAGLGIVAIWLSLVLLWLRLSHWMRRRESQLQRQLAAMETLVRPLRPAKTASTAAAKSPPPPSTAATPPSAAASPPPSSSTQGAPAPVAAPEPDKRRWFPAYVFGAYDIRGRADEDLPAEAFEQLGIAFAALVRKAGGKDIVLGCDARLSSERLHHAISRGLVAGGVQVIDLVRAPTPLVYFAHKTWQSGAAVMVTGSHNPPEYNGCKLMIGGEPVAGPALQALYRHGRTVQPAKQAGERAVRAVSNDYLARIAADIRPARPLKVVVDGGHGVAGELAIELLQRLGCEVIGIHTAPDGRFPVRPPDPSQPEHLVSLIEHVLGADADLGVAFDSDGDRLAVIDDKGEMVWADRLLMLFAGQILPQHPGRDVVYDVKSSRALDPLVRNHGGRPVMWSSGHTRIQQKMTENRAILGGEFSGHLFFQDRWIGVDDGIYAAARLVELLAAQPKPLSDLLLGLPQSVSTREYLLPLKEGESRILMRELVAQASFPGARIIDIDGLRIEFPDSWGLVRASNTLPALSLRFEADDAVALEGVKKRFRVFLDLVKPGLSAHI